jgi:hypothetical protein
MATVGLFRRLCGLAKFLLVGAVVGTTGARCRLQGTYVLRGQSYLLGRGAVAAVTSHGTYAIFLCLALRVALSSVSGCLVTHRVASLHSVMSALSSVSYVLLEPHSVVRSERVAMDSALESEFNHLVRAALSSPFTEATPTLPFVHTTM